MNTEYKFKVPSIICDILDAEKSNDLLAPFRTLNALRKAGNVSSEVYDVLMLLLNTKDEFMTNNKWYVKYVDKYNDIAVYRSFPSRKEAKAEALKYANDDREWVEVISEDTYLIMKNET